MTGMSACAALVIRIISTWRVGLLPAIVTAKDIIEYDMDAKPINGDRPDQYSERYIHSEIYKARPDVNAVVHAHTPELVAFAASSVPLASFDRTSGSYVKENLPIFDIRKYNGGRPGIVQTQPLGKALAEVLGTHQAALMLGHGVVVVSPSIYGLIAAATGLRKTAKMQEQAIALGKKLTYLEPERRAGARRCGWWRPETTTADLAELMAAPEEARTVPGGAGNRLSMRN